MSYTAYKVLHIFAILITFTALGGMALHAANGGSRETNASSKLTGALHGIGLIMIIVSGMGILARLGLQHGGGFPGWVLAKMGLWLVLGLVAVAFKRSASVSRQLLWILPLLGAVGAWLAIYKPF